MKSATEQEKLDLVRDAKMYVSNALDAVLRYYNTYPDNLTEAEFKQKIADEIGHVSRTLVEKW